MENTITFFHGEGGFAPFGIQHIGAVLTFLVLGIVVIGVAKYKLNTKQQYWLGNALAFFITGSVILWTIFKIVLGTFTTADFPIALCNFSALVIPIMMYYKSYEIFEVLYFWVLAGTMQANFTPDLHFGFPHFAYFKYWIVHSGLIVVICYAMFVFNWRPHLKSMLKSYIVLWIYFFFTIFINFLTGDNHMYLNHKPVAGSLLDYMGAWPYYIGVVILLIIPFFFVVYSPWLIKDAVFRFARRNS